MQHDDEPDTGAIQLHRELRRRIAAESGRHPNGGRHARRDGRDAPPPTDYVPRHAMSTPGPGTLPPVGPDRIPPVPAAEVLVEEPPTPPAPPAPPPKRVRVVLAERKRPIHPVGPAVHMQELDDVGEVLSSNLIKSQLGLSLRFGGIAAIALGILPVLFAAFPTLGRVELLGIRLPWLVLGVLSYPFLLSLGWLYSRATERLELSFTEHIRE